MPFGSGSAVSSICASILFDKRNVRAVSHYQPDYGCCLSMPVILGRKGIVGTIKMPLSSGEEAAIADSANTLRTTISRIRESTG
jgi:L-lactate dehydrogenase